MNLLPSILDLRRLQYAHRLQVVLRSPPVVLRPPYIGRDPVRAAIWQVNRSERILPVPKAREDKLVHSGREVMQVDDVRLERHGAGAFAVQVHCD